MRVTKFRGIHKGEWVKGCYVTDYKNYHAIVVDSMKHDEMLNQHVDVETVGQFTGSTDKNGVDIYFGDLLNIYYTSSDGEYIHDCIYEAVYGDFGGLAFKFVNLLWEDAGQNQYPISNNLCLTYNTLSTRYDDELKRNLLCVPDSHGSNYLCGSKWKQEDQSTYFEVIGNIHQNKDLLND